MAEPEYKVVKILQNASVEYSPADRNIEYVKNIIHQRENPDPFLAFGLVAGILIVMYIMYVLFIKRRISGIWFGNIGEMPLSIKYKIIHNPFTDTLTIRIIDSGLTLNGRLIGNTIWLYDSAGKENIGVLTENNQIIWVNSKDVWNHVKILD
jgi:hypothetical protein